MVRTYDLLRSPTADTADGTVITTGVTELPSMEHVDTPGDGTWRYWARTDEDGVKSAWTGPTDPVTFGTPAPMEWDGTAMEWDGTPMEWSG